MSITHCVECLVEFEFENKHCVDSYSRKYKTVNDVPIMVWTVSCDFRSLISTAWIILHCLPRRFWTSWFISNFLPRSWQLILLRNLRFLSDFFAKVSKGLGFLVRGTNLFIRRRHTDNRYEATTHIRWQLMSNWYQLKQRVLFNAVSLISLKHQIAQMLCEQ